MAKIIHFIYNYFLLFKLWSFIWKRFTYFVINSCSILQSFSLLTERKLNLSELIEIVERIDQYERIIKNLSDRVEKLEWDLNRCLCKDSSLHDQINLSDISIDDSNSKPLETMNIPPPPPPLPPKEFNFTSTPNPVFVSQQKTQFNGRPIQNDDNFVSNKKQRSASLLSWSISKQSYRLVDQILWTLITNGNSFICSTSFTNYYPRLFLDDLIQQRKLLRKITRNSLLGINDHINQSLNDMVQTALKRKFAQNINHSSTMTSMDESQFSERTEFSM
ncbi:hypothetical protein DERP_014144 [Dermatophagoides pteronyssinus]|uniref:Uncharacterized protein n=1 Tax=Dermatophagoides pteronyssinus TaxID=6956 RepID=A0ABQ8IY02_DERPT|nr:hypothetical protein DERP_014144 [Dermatophagoides pteronyssinus]